MVRPDFADFETLSETAHDLAQSWFIDATGKDVFELDGISYGLVPQLDVFHLVRGVCERGRGRKRLLPSIESAKVLAKEAHVEWRLKKAASRLIGKVRSVDSPQPGVRAVFVYDVWNTGSIDSLLIVQEGMSAGFSHAALAFDPRVWNIVRRRQSGPTLLYPVGFSHSRARTERAIRDYWLERYRSHRPVVRDLLADRLPAVADKIITRIDSFVRPFFGQLAEDRSRALWVQQHVRPEVLVMATDCHKWVRLLTLLSRTQGIRTLVVQHGVPVGKHAYVPLLADDMAVWGSASEERLRNWGAPSHKLVITGQPRFDRLWALRTKKRGTRISGRPMRVVVATSPLTPEIDTQFMEIVMGGLESVSGELELVLKLHPGTPHEAFFRRFVDGGSRRWTVIRHCDIHQLLSEADVVIVTQSTVGIEALAMGAALVVVDIAGVPQAVPYGERGAAFVAKSTTDLTQALAEIMKNSPKCQAISNLGGRLVEEHLYRLDGRAAARVVELIEHHSGTQQLVNENQETSVC